MVFYFAIKGYGFCFELLSYDAAMARRVNFGFRIFAGSYSRPKFSKIVYRVA